MFDRNERAEIRALCHEELQLIHRANRAAGSYRFLCMVAGRSIYSHQKIGVVIRDREEEPDL